MPQALHPLRPTTAARRILRAMLTAIDHIIVAAPDCEAAAAPFQRLGLTTWPRTRHLVGTENAGFMIGDDPKSMFYVELLGTHDREATAATPRVQRLLESIDATPGALRIMFEVTDLVKIARRLGSADIAAETAEVKREDGELICNVIVPLDSSRFGCEVGFVQYARTRDESFAARQARDAFAHELPLKRLDHLAVIAPQLGVTTSNWDEILDVRLHGTVKGRGMIINQLKIGDAIVELLGLDSADSPLASRPAGLISMAAFEVADLPAAVEHARARGFTISDPAPGALPGTHTATISGDQASGLSVQLLQYV